MLSREEERAALAGTVIRSLDETRALTAAIPDDERKKNAQIHGRTRPLPMFRGTTIKLPIIRAEALGAGGA